MSVDPFISFFQEYSLDAQLNLKIMLVSVNMDQWWIDPLPEDFNIETCIKKLSSIDPKIRAQAAWELSTAQENYISIEKAIPKLFTLLTDKEPIATGASFAIRYFIADQKTGGKTIEIEKYASPLIKALKSEYKTVKENCMWTLKIIIRNAPPRIAKQIENELKNR